MSSNQGAGASKPDGIEPDGESLSSSSPVSARTDDDDKSSPGKELGSESAFESQESTPAKAEVPDNAPVKAEGPEAAIEAAGLCFGAAVAAEVQSNAARIGNKIGGRWDCYVAAIFRAKVSLKRIEKIASWCLSTAQDYARNGIDHAAIAARQKVQEQWRREREARERTQAGAAVRPREVPEMTPEEEVSLWQEWMRYPPGNCLRKIAEAHLAPSIPSKAS